MDLKHLTSLDLAKKAKELGLLQESEYFLILNEGKFEGYVRGKWTADKKVERYASYIASEWLDILPDRIKNPDIPGIDSFSLTKKGNKYAAEYGIIKGFISENLCDALAQLWIYLRENKLIKRRNGHE